MNKIFKKTPLALAIVLSTSFPALAGGITTDISPTGAVTHQYYTDGGIMHLLSGEGTSSQSWFDKHASQHIQHVQEDKVPDVPDSSDDSFSDDATQEAPYEANIYKAHFKDHAKQLLGIVANNMLDPLDNATARSTSSSFVDNSEQILGQSYAQLSGAVNDAIRTDVEYFKNHDPDLGHLNELIERKVDNIKDYQEKLNHTIDKEYVEKRIQELNKEVAELNENKQAIIKIFEDYFVKADVAFFSKDKLNRGISQNESFTDNASQTINNTSQASGDIFSKHAKQFVNDDGSSLGNRFTDNASQELNGTGAKSQDDRFAGNAEQQVHGGTSSGAQFHDASTLRVDSGTVKDAILYDHAKGYLYGTARAVGTTTVNDNATLYLTAAAANGTRADNVRLNGGTLEITTATIPSPATPFNAATNIRPEASVDHLTVNNGTVRFADAPSTSARSLSGLHVGQLDGKGGTLVFNTSLATGSNLLSADTITEGHYDIQLNDATDSKEVTRKMLKDGKLDVIKTKTGENKASYSLTEINGHKTDRIDLGFKEGKLVPVDNDGKVTIIETDNNTRSADALLGALTSGLAISDGEMKSVRLRRGQLENAVDEAGGVWGQYLNNSTRMSSAGTGYRLDQSGMELGGDTLLDVGSDRLALGMFGTFSKNKIKHNRGDNSNVNSWGGGLYATWFGAQGYYIDGVLKYNHFSTDIHSKTGTGSGVSGSFTQNGLGASLETGYRFTLPADTFVEPYLRAAYFTADGEKVTLSNGLEGKADRLQSERAEAGFSAGKRFTLENGIILSPYATAAAEYEFKSHNRVRLNDAAVFSNDFSGVAGRYGLGVTSQLTHNTVVYAEADYRKGEHVESPLMANAGFRISF